MHRGENEWIQLKRKNKIDFRRTCTKVNIDLGYSEEKEREGEREKCNAIASALEASCERVTLLLLALFHSLGKERIEMDAAA